MAILKTVANLTPQARKPRKEGTSTLHRVKYIIAKGQFHHNISTSIQKNAYP